MTKKYKLSPALHYLPEDKWWKLFIDKADHHKGSMAYDNEESLGFNESMMGALKQVILEPGFEKLDFGTYEKMYDLVTSQISEDFCNIKLTWQIAKKKSGLSSTAALPCGTPSEDALQELSKIFINGVPLIKIGGERDFASVSRLLNAEEACKQIGVRYAVFINNFAFKDREKLVNGIFLQHYSSIKKIKMGVGSVAENDFKKLEVIADTVRNLHIGHFFPDGNGRLNMPIVMNSFLSQAGLMPAILPNGPAVFGGSKTNKELVSDMVVGMREFIKLFPPLPVDLESPFHCHNSVSPEFVIDRLQYTTRLKGVENILAKMKDSGHVDRLLPKRTSAPQSLIR